MNPGIFLLSLEKGTKIFGQDR